jgi:hydrogenase maturation factor
MSMLEDPAPSCGPDEHCITCGDVGIPMRVVSLGESDGLARCVGADGATELVDPALVGDVLVGDAVLVHAGVALTRLDPEAVA